MPKINIEDIPARISMREPQLVEQLAEARTILYFLKQKVDIPVPGRGGPLSGLQGFLPGQSSTGSFVEQNVDFPVPGGGLRGSPFGGAEGGGSGGIPVSIFPEYLSHGMRTASPGWCTNTGQG